MRLRIAGPLVLLILLLGSAQSSATTITFSELPFQPVDGLSFMGVTFDFKVSGVDSLDANFNSGGPGIITYVADPSLEGNANGILTLDFAVPVDQLAFGAALSTPLSLTPGLTVQLFDPSLASLGVIALNTLPLVSFSEGLFVYAGSPVSRAVIDFNFNSRFALDNLQFDPVPEPTTIVLVTSGLVGMGVRQWRKRRSQ